MIAHFRITLQVFLLRLVKNLQNITKNLVLGHIQLLEVLLVRPMLLGMRFSYDLLHSCKFTCVNLTVYEIYTNVVWLSNSRRNVRKDLKSLN